MEERNRNREGNFSNRERRQKIESRKFKCLTKNNNNKLVNNVTLFDIVNSICHVTFSLLNLGEKCSF